MFHLQVVALLIHLAVAPAGSPPEAGKLVVQVCHPDAAHGKVLLAVYNREEGFLDGGHLFGRRLAIEGSDDVLFELDDLPYGDYALALFHDLNGNEHFDTNLLGIPVEPYAFSNNVRAKWSKPRYHEASFDFRQHGQRVVVQLKRWRAH